MGIFFIVVCSCFLLYQKLSPFSSNETIKIPDRESLIPTETIKMTLDNDKTPPLSLSGEYENPVPLPYSVNTRGAEDSPFVMPDGKTLYVWFTPDGNREVIAQTTDMATGIYKFEKFSSGWNLAERLWFAEPDEAHLDGCGFFQDNNIWFCDVREGFTGMQWLTSENKDGEWSAPEIVEFIPDDEIGELHMSNNGNELYFHSFRFGGLGGMDIWLSRKIDGAWQQPENLVNINSEDDESWPALSPSEDELWITRNYGLWRSMKINSEWQAPELMFSPLAGEATIDSQGNVYFTHHYYENDRMIESDIYIAYKK